MVLFRDRMLREPVWSGGCGVPGLYPALSGHSGWTIKALTQKELVPLPWPLPAPLLPAPLLPAPMFLLPPMPWAEQGVPTGGQPPACPSIPGQRCIFHIYLFSLPMTFARLKSLSPLASWTSSAVHFRNKYLIRWKKMAFNYVTHLTVGVFWTART